MTRIEALAKFLSIEIEVGEELEDYITEDSYTENAFDAEGGTYLVLTEEEADLAATEYVKSSLWAFNASFLAEETGLPEEVFSGLQDQCEGANDTFLTLVEKCCEGGIEEFAAAAINADGRGRFLSHYNGAEEEEGEFYIYRTN